MIDFKQRIVVDGNDGTGKTTLVNNLKSFGFCNVFDRAELTKATDNNDIAPIENTKYILLTCSLEKSKERLQERGANMNEYYHTDNALIHYNNKFNSLIEKFNAKTINTSDINKYKVFKKAIKILLDDKLFRIGIPTGRLKISNFIEDLPNNRQLIKQADPFLFLKSRSKAFPKLVAFGELDIAFCGSDVFETSPFKDQLEIIESVRQPGIKMVVASATPIDNLSRIRIATPYEEIAHEFFSKQGIPHSIFNLSGTSEGFVPTFADVVVDIVETGDTLKANGLKIIHELGELKTYTFRRKNDIF